jgi:hypothetical protein
MKSFLKHYYFLVFHPPPLPPPPNFAVNRRRRKKFGYAELAAEKFAQPADGTKKFGLGL